MGFRREFNHRQLAAVATHPLVIIGPNGVGKTRLGVNLARTNSADRIAALRNVEIAGIPMQRYQQANEEVRQALDNLLNQHWRQSHELQNLLSEIIAEDREKAVEYRRLVSSGQASPNSELVNTRLSTIVHMWNKHFPNRKINIDYEPMVERTVGGNTHTYTIAQMRKRRRAHCVVLSCARRKLHEIHNHSR